MGVDTALDRLDAAVGARVAAAGAQAAPLVIVTTGSRDLAWRVEDVETALLAAVGCRRVELLLTGGFSPLTGFLNRADYDRVQAAK
jgi:ATP sulfurylase